MAGWASVRVGAGASRLTANPEPKNSWGEGSTRIRINPHFVFKFLSLNPVVFGCSQMLILQALQFSRRPLPIFMGLTNFIAVLNGSPHLFPLKNPI